MRCEQGAKGGAGAGGLDVWLSRGAMLGFVGAVTVELTTGKGVLQVWNCLSRSCLLWLTDRDRTVLILGIGRWKSLAAAQNVGLTAPLPTLALALTGVVGVLTAFLIFQSGTPD